MSAKRKLDPDSTSCVVAVDFGTSGTGFAFGFKQPDDRGREVPIIEVISKALAYVKSCVLIEINKAQLSDIDESDIHWVLTVPAIWTDIAKGAMRQAATRAGLVDTESSERLQLALEPEAACIACEHENPRLKKGDAFMVLDCGGGTADITMHRVLEKEPQMQLDELAPPSGGPFGSTFVDLEFEKLMQNLVGSEAFGRFKPSAEWVQLMRTWEGLKLAFDPGADSSLETHKLINVSPILEVVEGQTLAELVKAYNERHGASLGCRGKSNLLLPLATVQAFFVPVMSKIISHVRELLKANRVDYIFLVGGFAESPLLLHRVRNEFEQDGGPRVVVPLHPGLAVLKGAAMLGLGAAGRFASRISRCTYCVATMTQYNPFSPDHRNRETVLMKSGGVDGKYIKDGCTVIVRKGARISVDETHRTASLLGWDDRTQVACRLFATPAADACWTTDAGMVLLGHVNLPVAGGERLRLELSFGRTDIRAVAVNERTGARQPVVIDYDFGTI